MSSSLTTRTLVWRSFEYFRRQHLALMLGIAAATAVIVGALVVGDTVRGSLKSLVISRLGNIEHLLVSRNYFQPTMLSPVKVGPDETLVPLIVLTGSSAEFSRDRKFHRAANVTVFGVDTQFVDSLSPYDRTVFPSAPASDQVVLSESLANELQVDVGDEITLQLSMSGGVPADSPLGRRDEIAKTLPRQKVVRIVTDRSVGALQLRPGQQAPLNVFASKQTLQDFLEIDDRINAGMVTSQNPTNKVDARASASVALLNEQLQPTLEDLGLQLDHHVRVYPDSAIGEDTDQAQTTVYDYYQITSKDLLIDRTTERAIVGAIGVDRCLRLLAYLSNSIQKGIPSRGVAQRPKLRVATSGPVVVKSDRPQLETDGRVVPYSIVVGVSKSPVLSTNLLPTPTGETASAKCFVNTWLATELDLSVGNWLQLEYFEPETVDGRPVSVFTPLQIAGIVDLVEPATPYARRRPATYQSPPTIYNDPNMTPTVPGITDQASIANWDVPFELELKELILKQDDEYWENHRLTPKILMPLEQAQTMFGSRFGGLTSIRVPADLYSDEAQLRAQLESAVQPVVADLGLSFQPLRQQQLRSASGTTPFDMLFLSLSFFVIVAALLLVSLIFRLGIQQRAPQLGLLIAQGYTTSQVRRILVTELAGVAVAGACIGLLIGLGYAKLLVAGLESWWLGAISIKFLQFSFSKTSLIVGLLAGVLTSLVTIYFSFRSISALPPLALLRGAIGDLAYGQSASRVQNWIPSILLGVVAIALAVLAAGQSGMAKSGAFLGSGMLMLACLWYTLRQYMMHRGRPFLINGNLLSLALGAVQRNPLRSSLSIGLLGVATFLIASMGVFRMSPTQEGCGGFDLVATSSRPIYNNMASDAARREAIGAEADKLKGAVIMPFRLREGDNASCTNLYQPGLPSFLGVPTSLQRLTDTSKGYRFAWAGAEDSESPWAALQQRGNGSKQSPFPVVLDQNTALWSLKQGGGVGKEIVLELDHRTVYFRVVGLLNNSILQGRLMISERHFESLFPTVSGYSYFLVKSGPQSDIDTVSSALEAGWSESGLNTTRSRELLDQLMGVQNTYISAFQSLGALGLLLGTIGLIAVQLRGVWERRSELALMQAIGFSHVQIGQLLTLETAILLGLGLLLGLTSAAIALIPYVIEMGPQLSVLQPIVMLLVVFICGFVSSIFAVRLALRLPLLQSLRNQ